MSKQDGKPTAQQAASEPTTVQLPAQPTPPPPTQPVEVKTEPATPPTEAKVEAPVDTTEVKVEVKSEIKKAVAKTGTAKVTKTVRSTKGDAKTQKATTGSGALMDPNAETKQEPPPTPKAPEKKCNPFESMHGCSSK
jgi:hypothetical protein